MGGAKEIPIPIPNADGHHLRGQYPTWTNFVAHPNFDAFWQREAVMQYLDRVTVPTLNVAGWWDQEDFYGPLTIYRTLERGFHIRAADTRTGS